MICEGASKWNLAISRGKKVAMVWGTNPSKQCRNGGFHLSSGYYKAQNNFAVVWYNVSHQGWVERRECIQD